MGMFGEMEVRWVIRRKKVTAAQVAAYRDEHSVTMEAAKRILTDERGPTLQYRIGIGYEWHDVPIEVIEE